MRYWMSSNAMTFEITVESHPTKFDETIITKAAPIAKRFIGQPLGSLMNWMEKQGNFRMEYLGESE